MNGRLQLLTLAEAVAALPGDARDAEAWLRAEGLVTTVAGEALVSGAQLDERLHPEWEVRRCAAKVAAGLALSIREAAAWLGIDRGVLSQNLVVIPFGRPPVVEPGRFPARRVGNRTVILPADVLGSGPAPVGIPPTFEEERHACDQETSAPAAPSGRDFHRQIRQLRRRGD